MFLIVCKALMFLLLIGMGYFMRQKRYADKDTADFLSRVIFTVTLPCALAASFQSVSFSGSLLILLLLGFGSNVLLNVLAWLMNKNRSSKTQAMAMLNSSGWNIGTFAMPVILSFNPNALLPAIIFFDIGNALMCLGGNFTVADLVMRKDKTIDPIDIAKKLFSSVPFDTYLVLLGLSLMKIQVPEAVQAMASIAGNANPFLAMLMIGMMLQLSMSKSTLMEIVRILGLRYGVSLVLAGLVYFLVPLSLQIRQIVVLCLMAPISLAAPVFSARLKMDTKIPAAVNSLSILISIFLLMGFSMLFWGRA